MRRGKRRAWDDTVYIRVYDGFLGSTYHSSYDCATSRRGGYDPSDGSLVSCSRSEAETEDVEPCGVCTKR